MTDYDGWPSPSLGGEGGELDIELDDMADDRPIASDITSTGGGKTEIDQSPKSLNAEQLGEEIDALSFDLDQLYQAHEALESRVSHLFALAERLEEGLTSQLERVTADRRDLADARHLDQLKLAETFRVLVEQRILPIAAREARLHRSGYKPERVARLVSEICAVLFRLPGSAKEGLLHIKMSSNHWADVAGDLAAKAESLYQNVAETGLPFYWDFYLAPRKGLDESWQEPWVGCDANWPARFVVVPGYFVGGQIFCRQRVFTAPRGQRTPKSLAVE
ncbi:hypothetical protein [Micromonospora musae]|uniref:hypothetical protein n=1 Tax=Micromonospora musae TaxID=1894970 RepID=UPI0011C49CC6|nr:hypothetical protein [Micromonospora musae]